MELHRIGHSEIDRDDHFSIEAVYNAEFQLIVEAIRREANEAMSAPEQTHERALGRMPRVLSHIQSIYAKHPLARDPELLHAAAKGELSKHVPARGTTFTFLFLCLTMALAELGVGIMQYVLGASNLIVILYAVFLIGGGFLLGAGLAGFLRRSFPFLPRHIDRTPPEERTGMAAFKFLCGAAIICGLSVLRTGGETEGAGLVIGLTLSLAVLVGVFEALYIYQRDKTAYLRDRMYRCQVWYATEQHGRCAVLGGSYATLFESHVRDI